MANMTVLGIARHVRGVVRLDKSRIPRFLQRLYCLNHVELPLIGKDLVEFLQGAPDTTEMDIANLALSAKVPDSAINSWRASIIWAKQPRQKVMLTRFTGHNLENAVIGLNTADNPGDTREAEEPAGRRGAWPS